jgi:hypothetical protein
MTRSTTVTYWRARPPEDLDRLPRLLGAETQEVDRHVEVPAVQRGPDRVRVPDVTAQHGHRRGQWPQRRRPAAVEYEHVGPPSTEARTHEALIVPVPPTYRTVRRSRTGAENAFGMPRVPPRTAEAD